MLELSHWVIVHRCGHFWPAPGQRQRRARQEIHRFLGDQVVARYTPQGYLAGTSAGGASKSDDCFSASQLQRAATPEGRERYFGHSLKPASLVPPRKLEVGGCRSRTPGVPHASRVTGSRMRRHRAPGVNEDQQEQEALNRSSSPPRSHAMVPTPRRSWRRWHLKGTELPPYVVTKVP